MVGRVCVVLGKGPAPPGHTIWRKIQSVGGGLGVSRFMLPLLVLCCILSKVYAEGLGKKKKHSHALLFLEAMPLLPNDLQERNYLS